jgi:hypothetical protein
MANENTDVQVGKVTLPNSTNDPVYPEQIREAQGDLADRANVEVDQEIQAAIFKVRQNLKAQDEKREIGDDGDEE